VGVFLTNIWEVYANNPRGKFYGRFAYDTLLALILVNIMLNIVTGIIIDEFGALKDAMDLKNADIENVCFICGIDREAFDQSSIKFEVHLRRDHYQWNYLYYITYLRKKDQSEYTGTESYVNERLNRMDLDWFPIQRYPPVKSEHSRSTTSARKRNSGS
jgi:hypothetical protein